MSGAWENRGWSSTWCGYGPPTWYGELAEKYKKFEACVGFYSGIGDFDYWVMSEVMKLTKDEKMELLQACKEGHPKTREVLGESWFKESDSSSAARKIKGPSFFNPDGSIIDGVNEFAEFDSIGPLLTLEECRDHQWPHNARSRHTDGFECRDCGGWFSKNSEDYRRSELVSDYLMFLNNIKVVCFHREGKPYAEDVLEAERILEEHSKLKPFSMSMDDVEKVLLVGKVVVDKYKEEYKRLDAVKQ